MTRSFALDLAGAVLLLCAMVAGMEGAVEWVNGLTATGALALVAGRW